MVTGPPMYIASGVIECRANWILSRRSSYFTLSQRSSASSSVITIVPLVCQEISWGEKDLERTHRHEAVNGISQDPTVLLLQFHQCIPQPWLSVVHSLHLPEPLNLSSRGIQLEPPPEGRGIHQLTKLIKVQLSVLILVYFTAQCLDFFIWRI